MLCNLLIKCRDPNLIGLKSLMTRLLQYSFAKNEFFQTKFRFNCHYLNFILYEYVNLMKLGRLHHLDS